MPLPRFNRLSAEEQRRILDVALDAFAADGVHGASYNQIIAAAGISRSSAYNYFDGRDDLLDAVLDDVAERVNAALGSWGAASDADEFWSELFASAERMAKHVQNNPADLALIDMAFIDRARGGYTGWVEALVDNGIQLGLVTIPVDRDLLVVTTMSVLGAFDTWAADRARTREMPDVEVMGTLLRHLWGTPEPSTIGP